MFSFYFAHLENKMLADKKKIIVSTGNILNANKKAGQKTTEEVSKQNVLQYLFTFVMSQVTQKTFFIL